MSYVSQLPALEADAPTRVAEPNAAALAALRDGQLAHDALIGLADATAARLPR